MNGFRYIIVLICITMVANVGIAQVDRSSDLFKILKSNDSLLFDVGFNTCDIEPFEMLVDEDFEFYHDQSGILSSKEEFIANTKNGLCGSPATFQARRALVEGSLEVHPLKNNGELYGALQTGNHRFFEKVPGKPESAGSIAKFSHLWLLRDGEWKISRVLSYDHKMPNKNE